MKNSRRPTFNRRTFNCGSARRAYVVLILLLLLLPLPLHAQEQGQQPAAANSDDEVVYLDPNGYIRVYDPNGSPQITWVSPEGGWSAVALGDFTGEGDDEIVAVGGEGAGSRLVIYDPVVASGEVDAGQQFNGVPWRTLFATYLSATPRLVAVGEFNNGVTGDEIVYTADAPPAGSDPRSQLTILMQTAISADGTAWTQYATLNTGQQWSDISTGDLEVSGIDNIALIDEDRGVLSVFRLLDGALTRYYVSASDTREWSSSAIGNVDPETAQPELVLVRRADRPLASLIVWRFQAPDKFIDVYLRDFNPSPRVVFLADINGGGESEIFMLRNVTRTAGCPAPYSTAPFQLIMRNRGPDRPPTFEVCLDQANTFRYGTGADLAGDGKEEVIVLSTTQMRIFSNLDATFTASNVTVSSNARAIHAGNLDAAGSVKPNTLVVNQSRLAFTVNAGSESSTQVVQLDNSASSTPIPLRIHTSPRADFVRWSLSSSSTPAALTVSIDAAELLPDITYATNLVIDASGVTVSNTPLQIAILVKVESGLVIKPAAKTVLVSPCSGATAAVPLDLRIFGSSGTTFSAAVGAGPVMQTEAAPTVGTAPAVGVAVSWPVAGVPWISNAESPTTTVPSTITLTINPTGLTGFNQAHVAVDGQLSGVSYPRVANVAVLCTDYPTFLPAVYNEHWPD